MKTSFGKPTECKQNSEERKSRLTKVEGVNSKGGVEERRHGCNQTENKPAWLECGNTDRFKAQCPIWISKTKRWGSANPVAKKLGGAERK